VENFDTRILPFDQIQREIPGFGLRDTWIVEGPDGAEVEVFRAGPARTMTEVAPVDDPEALFTVPRAELRPNEELRVAVENYLDPILQRNGQNNFFFGRYLFNSVFVTVMATSSR
jgi:alpha-1,4-digalacturonate transport system permease protein